MARYECDTGGQAWTPEEDYVILEALLPLHREAQILYHCDRLAAELGRGHRANGHGGVNGQLVRRRAWGLMTRYSGTRYRGTPEGCLSRAQRGVAPATLFENELLYAALESRSAGVVHGADEIIYFAEVLNRPQAWVMKQLMEIQPQRAIGGFGFDNK